MQSIQKKVLRLFFFFILIVFGIQFFFWYTVLVYSFLKEQIFCIPNLLLFFHAFIIWYTKYTVFLYPFRNCIPDRTYATST